MNAVHPAFAGILATITMAPAMIARASQDAERHDADLSAHAAMRDCSPRIKHAADLIRGEQLFEADLQVLARAMQQALERNNMHLPLMRDAVNLLRDLQDECAAAIREAA